MHRPVKGDTRTFSRTFTVEEVEDFVQLTGDTQSRHLEPNEDGDVMVPGLLTATMPTKFGGDNEVLGVRMDFEFLRPVYTGEEITCTSTYDSVDETDDRFEFTTDIEFENEDGEIVLRADTKGIIMKPD